MCNVSYDDYLPKTEKLYNERVLQWLFKVMPSRQVRTKGDIYFNSSDGKLEWTEKYDSSDVHYDRVQCWNETAPKYTTSFEKNREKPDDTKFERALKACLEESQQLHLLATMIDEDTKQTID